MRKGPESAFDISMAICKVTIQRTGYQKEDEID